MSDQTAANMPRAWLDVMAERVRQITVEGWTSVADDARGIGDLAAASACYALFAAERDIWRDAGKHKLYPPMYWPWHKDWWKPTNRRRDLVKAGALILAEIERLDRASYQSGDEA